MSINRLLTRIAAVSALDNFRQQPWPTLAGPNVFDSKIEPVEDMAKDQVFPCCVVYTDYDKDHWNKGGKIHGPRLLTLTIELLIVQARKQRGGQYPTYQIAYPVTDSEIETSLDLLEMQVFRALAAGNEASDAFNYLCPGFENAISRRGASVEGGTRLAARQLTLELKAIRDPGAGVIPAEIAALLDRLEGHVDYGDRLAGIRAMMQAPASMTPGHRLMNTMGWTRGIGAMLGAPVGPQVLLPTNVTFLDPQGNPLT